MNAAAEKLAYTIPHFAEAVDLSVSTVYGAINSDELVPVYPAKRKPLITLEEGLRWLRSLPDVRPA
ncbi:hypothetical protein [Herbiconiux sp. YIM B11900]|uniref:hypothetical protein n=1 Tax=Herbiconiux sp. YIM B11900 TaxID=3404131 RepID=UPI003F868512